MGARVTSERPASAADENEALRAVVARGHTVIGEGGKRYSAGATVLLPADEVERLRAVGFLVDPSAPVARLDNGPSFGSAAGPQIRKG